MPLQPARSKGGLGFGFLGFESFPLCYTAGRHEGARQEAKVELMTEPADRAVLLLQKVGELLLESRAIVQQHEGGTGWRIIRRCRRPDRVWHPRGRARRGAREDASGRGEHTETIQYSGGDARTESAQ